MSLGEGAIKEDGQLIAKLFGSVGKIWEAEEKLFDAITGLRYVICLQELIPTVLQTSRAQDSKISSFYCHVLIMLEPALVILLEWVFMTVHK